MSHPMLQHQTTSNVLELLHMDVMGPLQIDSLGEKRYVFVVIDDFSGYSWMKFLKEKSYTFEVFKDLCQSIQEEKDSMIVKVRSDHDNEFKNTEFSEFCNSKGISHEFSCSWITQGDGIVKQKTRAIQESARVMLNAKQLPLEFWAEAINTACYIHNRVTLRGGTTTTLYELWKERKPKVKYFHIFGSKCQIFTDKDQVDKENPIGDEGIFLGHS